MKSIAAGESRQQVLSYLIDHKSGTTVDELVAAVGLSRTAVNQHLMVLEREGYVTRQTALRRTVGRPGHLYVLTESGVDLFPKKYASFSRLLLESMREQLGQEQLGKSMYDLGVKTSANLIPRLVGKNRSERVIEIVSVMNEAGFRASTIAPEESERLPRIRCTSCVYHDLSKDFPEVCRFDIGFLSGLMGAEIEHEACMQQGEDACRFRFKPAA